MNQGTEVRNLTDVLATTSAVPFNVRGICPKLVTASNMALNAASFKDCKGTSAQVICRLARLPVEASASTGP